MNTRQIIEPILRKTYGNGPMVTACVKDLADSIDGWPGKAHPYDVERGGRERMVMLRCWDWFSGGSTAESVARKIEDALASERTERA